MNIQFRQIAVISIFLLLPILSGCANKPVLLQLSQTCDDGKRCEISGKIDVYYMPTVGGGEYGGTGSIDLDGKCIAFRIAQALNT